MDAAAPNSPTERIVVGLSGGVDSAVAALLLQRQGYRVEGLFMKNWEEDDRDGQCSAAQDLADARAVAERLEIPLHAVNFSAEYWERVFEHFLAEYRAGRTPNPDVLCNREIKFRAFLDHALALGADAIATGHYARIEHGEGPVRLLKGADSAKDQSYFLYMLGQPALRRARFPLGERHKPEVRRLAAEAGFPNHAKRDSTGICFIGERNFRGFLARYLPARPGPIRSADGTLIGRHHGLLYYTLGQRQGLGIGGIRGYPDQPWYVIAKNLDDNTLVVAQGRDHPALYQRSLIAADLHWIAETAPHLPLRCAAKTRYRQPDQACTVKPGDAGQLRVDFDRPQWAVTPGQAVVFYRGDQCLGGGTIATVLGADALPLTAPDASAG